MTEQEKAEKKQEWLRMLAEHMVGSNTEQVQQHLTRIAQDLRRAADEIEANLKHYGPLKAADSTVNQLTWLFPNLNLGQLLAAVAQAQVHQGHLHIMDQLKAETSEQ